MNKMNRSIDSVKLANSKEKTIDYVMEQVVTKKTSKSFVLKPSFVLSMSLVLVMTFIILFGVNPSDPQTGLSDPLSLKAESVKRISELSYMSANLLSSELSVYKSPLVFLSDTEELELEENIDEFNNYFTTLKVFLDQNPFDTAVLTEYDGEEYQSTLRYMVEEHEYVFYINLEDGVVSGKLHYNERIFDVQGYIIEDDFKTEVELLAISGFDEIKLKYETSSSDGTKQEYKVNSIINGVEKENRIEVEINNNEAKVTIRNNQDKFELKKEAINEQVTYKLEYNYGEIVGEASIVEETVNGNKVYQYSIEENGKSSQISKGNPNQRNDNNPNPNNNNQNNNGNN